MALRTIRVDGDDILRKKSKPVKEMSERTLQLIDDMEETLYDAQGVGLAAVQVGVLKRLCLVNVAPEEALGPVDDDMSEEEYEKALAELPSTCHSNAELLVIINPTIEVIGDETQTGNEGCLSIPGKSGVVTRPNHIILHAQDERLKPYDLEATGFLARAIQHECDHMDGILYKDKAEGGIHSYSEYEEEEPKEE